MEGCANVLAANIAMFGLVCSRTHSTEMLPKNAGHESVVFRASVQAVEVLAMAGASGRSENVWPSTMRTARMATGTQDESIVRVIVKTITSNQRSRILA